jgi:GT2 family glycosyltransferase
MAGFDERFIGAAGEDVDLSLRLAAAGHTLYFEPAARVTHRPARLSAQAMARHLRAFGRAYYVVQREHPALVQSPLRRVPLAAAGVLTAISPLLACKDVLLLFRESAELRRHPHAFWGMLWGKTAWYWGAIEGLLVQSTALTAVDAG